MRLFNQRKGWMFSVICFTLMVVSTACARTGESAATTSPQSIRNTPVSTADISKSPSQASASPSTEDTVPEIVLYSIPDEVFQRPATEIPYYFNGEIHFNTKQELDQLKEGGHQPWKTDPLLSTEIYCRNLYLIGSNVPINPQNTRFGKTVTYYNGAKLTQLDNPNYKRETTHIRITVPKVGEYDVTTQQPENELVYIVTKIAFKPLVK